MPLRPIKIKEILVQGEGGQARRAEKSGSSGDCEGKAISSTICA